MHRNEKCFDRNFCQVLTELKANETRKRPKKLTSNFRTNGVKATITSARKLPKNKTPFLDVSSLRRFSSSATKNSFAACSLPFQFHLPRGIVYAKLSRFKPTNVITRLGLVKERLCSRVPRCTILRCIRWTRPWK